MKALKIQCGYYLAAITFMGVASPALTESCEQCLDKLNVKQGVACWETNHCIQARPILQAREQVAKQWQKEKRQKRSQSLQKGGRKGSTATPLNNNTTSNAETSSKRSGYQPTGASHYDNWEEGQ